MTAQSVVFHLHGRDPTAQGVVVTVDPAVPLNKIQHEVAEKLTILDPKRMCSCSLSLFITYAFGL